VHQAFALQEPRFERTWERERRHTLQQEAAARMPEAITTADVEPGPSRMASAAIARLSAMEEIVVSDVVLDHSQGRISIHEMPDQPGNCSQVFSAIARAGIVVDIIVQNISGPSTAELSFSVPRDQLEQALEITRRTMAGINPASQVVADAQIAKVSVLGVGMRTHTGVARRMFGALAQRGINISMISTSEIRVSVVVGLACGQEALQALKEAFNVR
jgi:aspartate kinase